jgi:hypothetical protein
MKSGCLTRLWGFAAVVMLGAVEASPAFGQTVSATVPGQASPYLAGLPNGSTCCPGVLLDGTPVADVAPNQSPVQVIGLPVTPGTVLTFRVTGSVSYLQGAEPTDPPDGGGFLQETAPGNGIAGVIAPINGLVGVFLDNSLPTSSPEPGALNFSSDQVGTDFLSLCPGLKQVFYIGDGLSGRGTGTAQQFMVPPRASRLFLGTVDGRTWQTNSGAFSVNVTAVTTAGGPAFAEVLSSGTSFRAGQRLSLGVHACNPPGGEPVDLYVGALFPDGDTIVFLAAPHRFGGLGQFSAPASVAPMLALEGGGRVSAEVLDFTFPAGGIPVGTYHVFAALFRRSSLGDNALNDGDLVWLDFFPLTFAP